MQLCPVSSVPATPTNPFIFPIATLMLSCLSSLQWLTWEITQNLNTFSSATNSLWRNIWTSIDKVEVEVMKQITKAKKCQSYFQEGLYSHCLSWGVRLWKLQEEQGGCLHRHEPNSSLTIWVELLTLHTFSRIISVNMAIHIGLNFSLLYNLRKFVVCGKTMTIQFLEELRHFSEFTQNKNHIFFFI